MALSKIPYIDTAHGRPLSLIPETGLVLSSANQPWRGITVEQFRLPPMEPPENAVQDHLLTLKLSPPSLLEWKKGRRFESRYLLPGDLCLAPADSPRCLRWRDGVEVLAIALDPASLLRIAQEAELRGGVELVEAHGEADLPARYLGLALQAELESGCPGGRLYADSLTTALAVHLLRRYNAAPFIPLKLSPDGLTPARLRRAIEFFQENLAENVSLQEAADAVGLSPSRFKLLFKRSTGLAPHQYVIEQRVERARRLLLQPRTECTISEIAVAVGFCDQSHLTRHFKRVVGATPRAYAEAHRISQSDRSKE